jgi:peptidyl-prolyl cis-trans isomerase D
VKTVGDAHYLYQVAAKEESRVPPLAEVRDKVAAEAIREKKAATSRAALEAILAASNSAAELEANAGKAGLSSSLTGWFAPLAEAAPEALAGTGDLRKDLSALSVKAPVARKAYQGRGGVSIAVAFSGEQLPSDAEWAQKKADFLKGMAEQKRNATLQAFLSDRRRSAKVEIHPEALK